MLIWTFSTRSYIYGNLYKNRVNISSGSGQSDASITIGQLTMADNGTYECSVSLMADLDGTSKSRVRLLVLVPPAKPDCGIEGETVIGNNIQLTCQSKEGSPAPQYSWKSYSLQNQERVGSPGNRVCRAGRARPASQVPRRRSLPQPAVRRAAPRTIAP